MLTKPKQEEKKSYKNSTIGSYWITTFGCQMNKADSERMAGILENLGYKIYDLNGKKPLILKNAEYLLAHEKRNLDNVFKEK